MKIINIDSKYRPKLYKRRNKIIEALGDHSLEDQFYDWALENEGPELYYLPIFWNKCHKNHLIIDRLEDIIGDIPHEKIFTINTMELEWSKILRNTKFQIFSGGSVRPYKYKNFHHIPLIHGGKLSSTKSKNIHISFMGNLTSQLRQRSLDHLSDNHGLTVFPPYSKSYGDILASSYMSYCPGGVFDNTIRIYEAMQLGSVPLIYTREDIRCFKDKIKWDEFSFWTNDIKEVEKIISSDYDLKEMGIKAQEAFYTHFYNSNWCKYVM